MRISKPEDKRRELIDEASRLGVRVDAGPLFVAIHRRARASRPAKPSWSSSMTEPTHAAAPIIDPRAFWRAIGNRATGSTVVTARSDEGPAGFLGLSATHICADPPLVLVSIDKRTSALQTILTARHFALNFLSHEAADIADMFGGRGPQKGAARFETGRWGTLCTGAPILLDAVGAIDCRLVETIERHGVVMAIGQVVGAREGASTAPLIHFRGGYLR
jgi:flavin reductase (DIM6/NTAB) family NADH-FMN oxidoreductase RutF